MFWLPALGLLAGVGPPWKDANGLLGGGWAKMSMELGLLWAGGAESGNWGLDEE